MKSRFAFLLQSLALSLLLCQCASYIQVKEKRVQIPSATGARQAELGAALTLQRKDPRQALAIYLQAASAAAAQLARTPSDLVCRDEYNFAVSRVFDVLNRSRIDPWTQPLTLSGNQGGWTLTRRPDPRKQWNPALYELKPADQFDTGGLYARNRHLKAGLGAPLVAIGRELNADARGDFALPRTYYGVTAILRFNGKHCEAAFHDPLAEETATLGGQTFPLAADFTVPVAVMLAQTDPMRRDLSRLLNPGKFAETARIARLQPYDPNKTVVLVVHGLNSSPATWAPMINALRANPAIRQNYQFWFYSYPSGYPYPHSAALLRQELEVVEKRFPLKKKMIVIGHSMGGCISRLLVTDVGDKLWLQFFGKPPAEVNLSDGTRRLFQDAIIFHDRPEIGRVIFIAAPLRGADMAEGWLGRFGARLVRLPLTLLEAGQEVTGLLTLQHEAMRLRRLPNSVDTLAPSNRFVKAINMFPINPRVACHTIVGDRGKGGHHDKTKPVQSDGLVPYWSSHLPLAQSELVVPSGHNAHQNDHAITEVSRILLQDVTH